LHPPVFLAPTAFLSAPGQLERAWAIEESLAYTRWLATHHYENFHIVSFLRPKRLHARPGVTRFQEKAPESSDRFFRSIPSTGA
jgi:hypothetical protein